MGVMKNAILAMAGNYVSGWLSREQFEDWFVPATWSVPLDAETMQLVNRIKLRLAEFLNGDWTEPELRTELAKLMPTAPRAIVSWSSAAMDTTTSCGPIGVANTLTVTATGSRAATMVMVDLAEYASA